MNQTQYFTLTQMIIDDVYFPWGATKLNQLGGGTYTVAGTRVWSDQVGFCCLIGPDFEETYSKWFRDNQIDMATVLKEKNTCHAKIHYFEDGEREELLLPGCGSHYEMLSRFTDIPERYRTAKGMYFFKDVDEPYWEQAKNWLGSYSGISCWEIAGNAAVHECKDAIADRLSYVDLFSLNLTEGKRITGETEPLRVVDVLRQMHADNVILRMGAKGALAAKDGAVWEIPAAPANVVDVTGGGNSSTGGFLVGYCESEGDIAYAARCAAVSASFIIEQWGVPPLMDAAFRKQAEEEKRFEVDRQMLLPRVLASPQEAFYADKIKVPIREAAGHISGEFVMAYPPGIPILAPGEEITDEIIDYIQYSVEKGCSMQGMEDSTLQTLNVLRM